MKKRLSTRIFAFLTALLLCIPLLGLAAGAEQVAPEAEEEITSPVFCLGFHKDGEVLTFTAFYVQDTLGDGSTYLVTAGGASVPAEAGYDAVLLSDNYTETAQFLGTVGHFTYFYAPGLENITPLAMGTAFTDTLLLLSQTFNEEGELTGAVYEEVDMTSGWEDHGSYFLAPDITVDDTFLMGAPLVESETAGVVGCFTMNGDYQLVLLSMLDMVFPAEAAIVPGSTGETEGSEEIPEPEPEKDYSLYIYIGIGAVVLLLIIVAANRKPAKKVDSQGYTIPSGGEFTGPQNTVALDNPSLISDPVPFNNNPGFIPAPATPAAAQWQIRCISGEMKGQTFLLRDKLTFGRSSQCGVVFSKNTPGVSGTHCEVSIENGSVVLRDLQSTYGTFLGKNVRMEPQVNYHLQVGDSFILAQDGPSFRLEKVGDAFREYTPAVRSVGTGTVYRADVNGKMVFGRDPRSQVSFDQNTSAVSTIHCTLYREGGSLYLMDNGSTNGTFFNENQRLKPNTPYKVRKGVSFFLVSAKHTYIITED